MAAPRVSLGALKEPLGLSRGLQWFFSIFAFATCGGFEGSVTFSLSCPGLENGSVSADFGYPFRLNQAVFRPSLTHLCNHTWPRDVHLRGDFSGAARAFVGVAVAAFLYSLGALGTYLGYLHLYRCAGSRLPTLGGNRMGKLRHGREKVNLGGKSSRETEARPPPPPPFPFQAFGFLNLLLWAGGCWFVYKETPLHRPAPPPSDPAPI
uniref:synaptophysin-like protein 1 n=1 Tax=Lonchura striata TaxID=40157 RepID=UPI001293CD6B|nr:synaptophysin-like protein 1 [Lonchura striata domestica]